MSKYKLTDVLMDANFGETTEKVITRDALADYTDEVIEFVQKGVTSSIVRAFGRGVVLGGVAIGIYKVVDKTGNALRSRKAIKDLEKTKARLEV